MLRELSAMSDTSALIAELRARAKHRADFHNIQPHTDIKLDAADLPEALAADLIEAAGLPRCLPDAKNRSLAIAAAGSASEAVTELLRFAREGADLRGTFGEIEVVEKLLDAAKMTIECLSEEDDAQRYASIYAGLAQELEGWI